jgi:DNA-binding transcriptional ArsR family regulator
MNDRLSAVLGALADPTRRAILARIAAGDVSLKELAKPFDISLQAVSKHLRVLEQAGLIERGRAAQARPCRIHPGGVKVIEVWIKHYRRLRNERLDRLDDRLRELQAKGNRRGEKR